MWARTSVSGKLIQKSVVEEHVVVVNWENYDIFRSLVKKVTKYWIENSGPKSRVFNSREKYGRTPQNRGPDNLARIIWEQSSACFRQI